MVTKEEIENTVKEILEIYPKLKEIIDNDYPWEIAKTKSAMMIEGTDKYLPGWRCYITSVNQMLNGNRGFISFSFDEEGEPKKIMVSDMGRPSIYILGRDNNGKIVVLD